MSTIKATIETVSPERAMELLKNNHSNQRNVTMSHQLHLSQQMKAGQWKMNGESLIFDHEGNVLDGQHRLLAIIQSGITADFVLVRGVDPECFPTIDRGKPRSNGNAFAIAGIANYNTAAAATMAVLNYRRALNTPVKTKSTDGSLKITGYGGSLNSYTRASTTDMLEEYWKHEHKYVKAVKIGIQCRPKCPPSCSATIAALSLIDGKMGDEWVESFWDSFYTGAELNSKSPVLKLRDRLEKNEKSQTKLTQTQIILLMAKAWNFYAREKECGVLKLESETAIAIA